MNIAFYNSAQAANCNRTRESVKVETNEKESVGKKQNMPDYKEPQQITAVVKHKHSRKKDKDVVHDGNNSGLTENR